MSLCRLGALRLNLHDQQIRLSEDGSPFLSDLRRFDLADKAPRGQQAQVRWYTRMGWGTPPASKWSGKQGWSDSVAEGGWSDRKDWSDPVAWQSSSAAASDPVASQKGGWQWSDAVAKRKVRTLHIVTCAAGHGSAGAAAKRACHPWEPSETLDFRGLVDPDHDRRLCWHVGLHPTIVREVSKHPFFQKAARLMAFSLASCAERDEIELTVATVCKGGRHRAVAGGELLKGLVLSLNPVLKDDWAVTLKHMGDWARTCSDPNKRPRGTCDECSDEGMRAAVIDEESWNLGAEIANIINGDLTGAGDSSSGWRSDSVAWQSRGWKQYDASQWVDYNQQAQEEEEEEQEEEEGFEDGPAQASEMVEEREAAEREAAERRRRDEEEERRRQEPEERGRGDEEVLLDAPLMASEKRDAQETRRSEKRSIDHVIERHQQHSIFQAFQKKTVPLYEVDLEPSSEEEAKVKEEVKEEEEVKEDCRAPEVKPWVMEEWQQEQLGSGSAAGVAPLEHSGSAAWAPPPPPPRWPEQEARRTRS